MNDTLRAADAIDQAANLILRPGGWIRGGFANTLYRAEQKQFCMRGALHRVLTGDAFQPPRGEALAVGKIAEGALERAIGALTITEYNDRVAKTQGEVVATMRKAAKALREGEA